MGYSSIERDVGIEMQHQFVKSPLLKMDAPSQINPTTLKWSKYFHISAPVQLNGTQGPRKAIVYGPRSRIRKKMQPVC